MLTARTRYNDIVSSHVYVKQFRKQADYASTMDFFGDFFGRSCSFPALQGAVLGLTVVSLYEGTSLLEGLNRVVGDGLSAQDWFATHKAEAGPVKLPWEASTAEELPYET